MPGWFECIHCGHKDYYYGSPLWAQTCRNCHKPVGIKLEEDKEQEEAGICPYCHNKVSFQKVQSIINGETEEIFECPKCHTEFLMLPHVAKGLEKGHLKAIYADEIFLYTKSREAEEVIIINGRCFLIEKHRLTGFYDLTHHRVCIILSPVKPLTEVEIREEIR